MQIFKEEKKYPFKKPVVTVGTFDGVHAGHRKILGRLKQAAEEFGGESVVFTLHPHPRKVLYGKEKTDLLNTLDEKAKLLEQFGIDKLIIYPFTKEFSKFTSCEFIRYILSEKLKTKHLIVGYDHHFGRDRQGSPELLQECTKNYGFMVERVEALKMNGLTVSSTKIRRALLAGEPEKAEQLLTYPYRINGTVTHGNKIGRTMGFPTANIRPSEKEKLIPAEGVYAVKASLIGNNYAAMLNIGKRPTINAKGEKSIEAHIIGLNQTVYDKEISICFKKHLRKEMKFPSKSALQAQLKKDRAEVLKLSNDSFF